MVTMTGKMRFEGGCGDLAIENAGFGLAEQTDVQLRISPCQSPHHPSQVSNFSLPSAAFRAAKKSPTAAHFLLKSQLF